MKKRNLSIIIALVAAVSLFSVTAFAFSDSNQGYEVLKEALQSSKTFDNGTFNVQFQITDNNEALASVALLGKANHTTENASGQLQLSIDGLTKSAEFYKAGSTAILVDKDNDLYYQVNDLDEHETERRNHFASNENFTMSKTHEALLDYLMGDLKNQVELISNDDGTKTVSLYLSEEEIPVPLNLMIAAAASDEHHGNAKKARSEQCDVIHNLPFFEGLEAAHTDLPKIVDDVKVTQLAINLTLDSNNQVNAYAFVIALEGNDANGDAHELSVNGTAQLSDLNSTIVDTLDLTGKTIEVLDITNCEK